MDHMIIKNKHNSNVEIVHYSWGKKPLIHSDKTDTSAFPISSTDLILFVRHQQHFLTAEISIYIK